MHALHHLASTDNQGENNPKSNIWALQIGIEEDKDMSTQQTINFKGKEKHLVSYTLLSTSELPWSYFIEETAKKEKCNQYGEQTVKRYKTFTSFKLHTQEWTEGNARFLAVESKWPGRSTT
jgi:hypothetical protein